MQQVSSLKSKRATMNPALRGFWSKPSQWKVLYGGRSSSKTWDAAANAIRIAQTVHVRILCARQFQNRIEESVYTVLCTQIERFGLSDRFEITKNKIRCISTGSEFVFYGIARNIAEIKGLEGIDILWLEEAESIKKEDYGILEGTMRVDEYEIWIIFNPRLANGFIYQHFVVDPPKGAIVRQINYDENPFNSDRVHETIEALKAKDHDEYLHRYKGIPRSDDDRAVIKMSWLESAVDAHEKLGVKIMGRKRVGFDVADDGGDKNATALSHGILCKEVDEWNGLQDELLASCSRAYGLAVKHGAEIDYDSIGVGATAGSKFQELNQDQGRNVVYRKFNAGGKVINPKSEYMPNVKNKDHFANIKAQAWWGLADRFLMTHLAVTQGADFDPAEIISISSGITGLKGLLNELATPHRHFDSSGRVKVESKEDLSKRQVKSPNRADAFIMSYAPISPIAKTTSKNVAGMY